MTSRRRYLSPVASLTAAIVLFFVFSSSSTLNTFFQPSTKTGEEGESHHRLLQAAVPELSATSASQQTFPTILSQSSSNDARTNAIVYLVQKKHSSYDNRDSYGLLLKSLDLLYENYLLVNYHYKAAHVFLFHTGDYNEQDLEFIENRYPHNTRGTILLVDLTNTEFWSLPEPLQNEDVSSWRGHTQFSLGYRHMIRFFAIKIWDFFQALNQQHNTSYRHIMRLDEESYIHSRVDYDIFDFMETNHHNYGFRICSYEMARVFPVWDLYYRARYDRSQRKPLPTYRKFRRDNSCGFYNNFFVTRLDFWWSPQVQDFLTFVDQSNSIYRLLTGDLVIHTAAIYAFSPPERIHRFLDFTYEHFTTFSNTKCLRWGALEAGYNDEHAGQRLEQFRQNVIVANNCPFNDSERPLGPRNVLLSAATDLTPTYIHLSEEIKDQLRLPAIVAGSVELTKKQIQDARTKRASDRADRKRKQRSGIVHA